MTDPLQQPPTADLIGRFSAATVYEAMSKSGAMTPDIRALLPNSRLTGPAFTVHILGSDTLAVLHAIDEAPPGCVLVIQTTGGKAPAVWGGTSALAASVRGIAGCVTNGHVRDSEELASLGLPIFARGRTVTGTRRRHPGWRNVRVNVGGIEVNAGDYIVGDGDGVVVVPKHRVTEVAEAAARMREIEIDRDDRVRKGEPITAVLGLQAARSQPVPPLHDVLRS